jgi:dipeptidyl aminopeptidase/acylaminoacyl peptidase
LIDLWGSPAKDLLLADIAPSFPPTLIMHGTADELVPFSQSEDLAAVLKAKGIEHRLYPISGAAHTPTADMDRLVEETAAFLFRALPASPAAAR